MQGQLGGRWCFVLQLRKCHRMVLLHAGLLFKILMSCGHERLRIPASKKLVDELCEQ